MATPAPRRKLFQLVWIAALAAAAGVGAIRPFTRRGPELAAVHVRPRLPRPAGWAEARAGFRRSEAADRGAVVFAGGAVVADWATLAGDFPGLRVANRGIAGDTSDALLDRFDDDIRSLEPRAVVLFAGTGEDASPEDIAANVAELLDHFQVRRPWTPVVLCALPGNEELEARLRDVAKARRGVEWCEIVVDVRHLGVTGYAELAGALRESLKRAGVD